MRTVEVALGALILILAVAFVAQHLFPKGSQGLPKSLEPFAQGKKEISVKVDSLSFCAEAPVAYTCDSRLPTVPKISWESNVKPKSYAIVVVDPDAPIGNFYHLIVYNIPPSVHSWDGNVGTLGLNSANQPGWFPICPPKGDRAHRYFFFVLALKVNSLPEGLTPNEFIKRIQGNVVAYGYTCLKYKR